MGTLRIEGEPPGELPREPYDLVRRNVLEPKAVCHAPFGSLHLGARLAPCRHGSADLGDPRVVSLQQGFGGRAADELRDRFRRYLVRRDECARCVLHWEDRSPAESPAQREYDLALPPVNGLPPRLQALSIDARVALPAARLAEARALLPQLDHVTVACKSLEKGSVAQELVAAVDALRSGPRPRLRLIADGFVPRAEEVPAAVAAVDVELPLAPLDAATQERLADLADELAERQSALVVRAEVGRSDWTALPAFLAAARRCDAAVAVAPRPRRSPDSFAALDGDLLALLHDVFWRFAVEAGVADEEKRGAADVRALLLRLREWQRVAADRSEPGAPLAWPALDGALLSDEAATLRLLQDALRCFRHPQVAAWLASLAATDGFVERARQRLSLRLVALWLTVVFERADLHATVRAIYRDAAAAAEQVAADRAALAGSPLQEWHDGWVAKLVLAPAPRGGPPFELAALAAPAAPAKPAKPAARKAATGGAAKVTIVVPSFNHEAFIGAALDSALAQSGPGVRVLVVDDASSDATFEIARARRDPRLTVRRNATNLGLGESLLRALKGVRTRFVAILNSDDLFHPRRIERLVAALEREPGAAVAASLVAPIDRDGRALRRADSSPIFDGKRVHQWLQWWESAAPPAGDDALLGSLLERNWLVSSSNLVCRRDWLLRHAPRWRDLEYCVDWLLFLLASAEGRLRVVREPLLGYRLHASNTVWFDDDREWRYWVESHRVVARALEASLAADGRAPRRRFDEQLALVATHVAANHALDGSGIWLGHLLERLGIASRELRGGGAKPLLQSLERLVHARQRAADVAATVSGELGALLSERDELPWLRAERQRGEAVRSEVDALRGELHGALWDRRNLEKLWHTAERERDAEVSGKAELYRRIGALDGELREARDATARQRAEVEQLRSLHVELQASLDALQREHLRVHRDIEEAMRLLPGDQVEARGNLTDALHSMDSGDDFVRGELEVALLRLREEQSRVETGLAERSEALQRELAHAREAHAQELARARSTAEERLATERRATEERLAAERRAGEERLAAAQAQAAAAAQRQAALMQELADQRRIAQQRTAERDALQRAPEWRLGNLVLNKLSLKKPLRFLERKFSKARTGWAARKLRFERKGLLGLRKQGGEPRVFSTICWNFPIYSQTFVYQELLQLRKRGFDVRVVYSKLDPRDRLHQQFAQLWDLKRPMHLDRPIHEADYRLYKARAPDRVERLVARLCAASGLSRAELESHDNFLQGFTYARLAEAWGADYLHSYFFYDRSLMSLIAGEVLGLPHGVTCYADHVMKDYELKVVPLHLETCDVVVATSHRIKRELLAIAPSTPPDKILVKPNAIDCTRFPVIPRPEPAAGQPWRLVVTSRIEPKKGLAWLVDAVKLLRDGGLDVEAHLVGDADHGVPASEQCKAELCARIERHGLWGKVHLEGRQPEQEVRRFLSIAHLFVAPFVETESGDKDGIPTALIEAMATGLPSVVTDAGSILEVVDDRVDARVVPQRDAAALAAAIGELLRDPEGRRHMANKAAQKARERFDVSVCEPRFHERVRAALAARRAP